MTESERDAGDRVAELLNQAADAHDKVGREHGYEIAPWSIECRAAIKAWEDAKAPPQQDASDEFEEGD